VTVCELRAKEGGPGTEVGDKYLLVSLKTKFNDNYDVFSAVGVSNVSITSS
jgi:hypothetical protein